MNEKHRAGFEKWWVENCDEYNLTTKLLCWQAWQAAIASVVVELPKVYRDAYADDYTKSASDGREHAIDDFKQSLKEAGIRYE